MLPLLGLFKFTKQLEQVISIEDWLAVFSCDLMAPTTSWIRWLLKVSF